MSIIERHLSNYDASRVMAKLTRDRAFNLTAAIAAKRDDAASWRDQQLGFGFLERHLDARSDHRIILGSDRRNAARLKRVEAERERISS